MLPKKYRLPSFCIPKLIKTGKRVNGDWLSIIFKKRKNNNLSRWAFVISKKISKSAVCRNRIKRQLSNIILNEFTGKIKGHDVIILVTKKITNKEFRQMKAEVKSVLENLKARCLDNRKDKKIKT